VPDGDRHQEQGSISFSLPHISFHNTVKMLCCENAAEHLIFDHHEPPFPGIFTFSSGKFHCFARSDVIECF
jgi:hypothetical protein